VISLQQAKWTFYDYIQGDKNPIQTWYESLTLAAQFQFDAVLKNCSKTENLKDWGRFRHFLEGSAKAERVWELGFVADRRQYRILGVFGDERKHAVLLIGCYHKGGNYTPSNAIETARKRAKGFREGNGGRRERKIETNI